MQNLLSQQHLLDEIYKLQQQNLQLTALVQQLAPETTLEPYGSSPPIMFMRFEAKHDLSGKVIWANEVALDVFGNARKGPYIIDLLTPDESRYIDLYLSNLQKFRTVRGTVKCLDKNGNLIFLDFKSELLSHTGDRIVHIVAQDVTVLRHTSHWLKQSNAFYKTIYDNDSSAILIVNERRQIIEVNQSAELYYKTDKQSLIGKDLLSIWPNTDLGINQLERYFKRTHFEKEVNFLLRDQSNQDSIRTAKISFKNSYFFGKQVTIVYSQEVSALGQSDFYDIYQNIQKDDEGLRLLDVRSDFLQSTILRFLSRLFQLNYIKAGGFWEIDSLEQVATLKFCLNLSNSLITKFRTFPTSRYPNAFERKEVLEIPPFELDAEQSATLLVVPLLIEEEVCFALLLEIDSFYRNANAILSMLASELSGHLTRTQLQRKVAKSENLFRTIADHSPALICLRINEFEITFYNKLWNDCIADVDNLDTHQAWLAAVHKEDRATVQSTIKEAFQTGSKYEVTYRLLCNVKKSYRWLLDNGAPYFDDNGKFQGYVCSAIDITEQKDREHAEQQQALLTHAKQQLESLLQNSPFVTLTLDLNFLITYCNSTFYKLTGWSPEDVIGEPASVFFQLDAPYEPQSIQQYTEVSEAFLKTSYGELLPVGFNTLLLNDAAGSLNSINIVAEDKSEKLKMLETMQRSHKMLKDLFDNATDLITIFNGMDGSVLFANRAWKRSFESLDKMNPRTNFYDVVQPRYLESTKKLLFKAKESGLTQEVSFILINKFGERIYAEGGLSFNDEKNAPPIFKAILKDTTQRTIAERSQRLYYQISKHSVSSLNLNELYTNVYEELKNEMNIDSFVLALLDKENRVQFPFYVNSPLFESEGVQAQELAEYALQSFKTARYLSSENIINLMHNQLIAPTAPVPQVWMGVPLYINQNKIGIAILQYFSKDKSFNINDLEILNFISGQLSTAIARSNNQEELRIQSANLEAIFESGSLQVWSVDQELRLLQFNNNFAMFINARYGTIAEKRLSLLSYYQKKSTEETIFWQEKYLLAFGGVEQKFEVQVLSESGDSIWHQILLSPIFDKEGRHVIEVAGVAQDITEQKQQNETLRQSEKKFRNIFESFQDLYFNTNRNGFLRMISPSVKDFFGFTETQCVGIHIDDLFQENLRFDLLLNELKHKNNRSIKNREILLESSQISHKHIIANFRLLLSEDGQIDGIEGTARDISELKQTTEELVKAKELAEKSLEVKKQFLSNMSHEIRTPMNGIMGMIDILGLTKLEPEQSHYVNTIKKSSSTLLNILNDILDLSKIEAGHTSIRPSEVAINNILDKLYTLFVQEAERKHNQLKYHIESNVPPCLSLDETRVLQILSNLTSNAIKFTENGQINIQVSFSPSPSSMSGLLMFEVKDTGIGIAENDLVLLFRSFSQVESNYTRSFGGTGLGLAISKELCRLMNGDIGVSSKPKQGSTFWFTVEANICDKPVHLVAHNLSLENSEDINVFFNNHPKILIVDDNLVNLMVASKILSAVGCRIQTARSGIEAIEFAIKENFDLIFMDIQMPEMSGITTTQILKSKKSQLPPIIALTAFTLPEEREEFLAEGMNDFLAKPIRAHLLIGKVQEWIKGNSYKEDTLKNLEDTQCEFKNLPILNNKAIQQLAKYGGRELLEDSLAQFSEEGRELLEESQTAFDKRLLSELRSFIHTIKGSCGTVGAERMHKRATALEKLCQEQTDPATLSYVLEDLRQDFSDFINAYKDYLASH
ncbi:MAG: PAS domain S-box protein [Cytophagales bacterium]|nr:MAG: PAS domain S-box protein [Cytophagales bacterium]TAF59590.1 MAG: PAS domain S-box protein [Cytophagales bacterium]